MSITAEFTARTYVSNRTSPFRFILSHIIRHPIYAFLMMLGAFANAGLAATVPFFVGESFMAISERGDLHFVFVMCVGIVITQAVRAVLQFVRNWSTEVYGQRIERDVRDELYGSLLSKSMSFHDRQPVGEVMALVTNDVRELNFMMNPGLNNLVGSTTFMLMPFLTAPFIHPALTIVPLVFVLVQVVVQYRFIRMLHPIAQEVRASFGHMNARLAESLEGLQVVKGAAQEHQEVAIFSELVDQVRDRYVKQASIEARYISSLLFPLTIIIGFIHAVYLFNLQEINIGDVSAFVLSLYLFQFSVFSTLFSLPRMALGYASAGRILRIINMESELDQNTAGHDAPMKGEIVFENVSFGYNSDKDVLHDISFTVKPGQTVAIVGQTGAGKSTVTKLMNRTYDATHGRVLVDGVDVRDWQMESLRSQISIIEQDIFLFSRSIAENIAFGTDEVNLERVEDAARKAQAYDFITAFEEGFETVIGQRGARLSGGQRQRVAIARAFQTDPPILILDDSTSAIDSATEDMIQQAIWTASQGRTTILITHRLSQIRWADHIVVLRRGHVVAQGTHDDLLESSEAYRRIFARYESSPESDNRDETP